MFKLLSEVKQGIFIQVHQGRAFIRCSLNRCKDSEGVSRVYIKEDIILVEGIARANALKGK